MSCPVLLYLSLILFAGLLFGRLVRLIHLPNVTGYLVAGLVIGPSFLGLLPRELVGELELISEIALALIAFTVGAEFKLSYLRKVGLTPVVIAIFEGLTAAVLVALAICLAGGSLEMALLLGAIASATAPAATIMAVRQYRTRGPVTDTLLSVVALDDAVALMAFGFAMAVVSSLEQPGQTSLLNTIASPFLEILSAVLLGFFLGYLFQFPLRFFRKDSSRLITMLAFVFLGSALADMLGLSALLLCMCMGAMLVNTCADGDAVMSITDSITPPIFLMFFVVSGAELDLSALPGIGLVGLLYVIVRVAGKILGCAIGAAVMKAPPVVRKYTGFTLIPQAGVAIGLSLIAANTLPGYGQTIRAVILCSTLIYELIGPGVTKLALKKAGEIRE